LEAEQKRIENARRGDMYAMHIIKNNFKMMLLVQIDHNENT